ncbi:hypothetical protein HYS79_01935 [Patescibacteria group bacterium]|nr:hypothetical protein [Patescibacteria group bacterium]
MRLNLKIGDPCVVAFRHSKDDDFVVMKGKVTEAKGSIWVDMAYGFAIVEGKQVTGRAFENEKQALAWITEQSEPVLVI